MSSVLTQSARESINNFFSQLQKSYGVSRVGEFFNVSPAMETKLQAAIVEYADFLKMINMSLVEQIQGQVVDVGVNGLYTGRKSGGRFSKEMGVAGHEYKLAETDSCAAATWDMLCQWSNQGDKNQFIKLLMSFVNQMFALDIMRIGWSGKSVAATTDDKTNPNGEDVNIGWQQYVIDNAKDQVVSTDIYFDEINGDFKTLDAMAQDLINTLIDPIFRNDPRLTVMVGQELIGAGQYNLYDKADTPSENIAAQRLDKTIAGRPAIIPPFMPAKGMCVTIPKNLQVLTQRGTQQRKSAHSDERKALENSWWRYEGYAVGVLKAYAAYDSEKVHIGEKPKS